MALRGQIQHPETTCYTRNVLCVPKKLNCLAGEIEHKAVRGPFSSCKGLAIEVSCVKVARLHPEVSSEFYIPLSLDFLVTVVASVHGSSVDVAWGIARYSQRTFRLQNSLPMLRDMSFFPYYYVASATEQQVETDSILIKAGEPETPRAERFEQFHDEAVPAPAALLQLHERENCWCGGGVSPAPSPPPQPQARSRYARREQRARGETFRERNNQTIEEMILIIEVAAAAFVVAFLLRFVKFLVKFFGL
ncbi:uncharacterized protein PAC_00938 [Phialocephala subalpina]|uniref:Uncharacterized protein n=1 Tax=Phialocephala subalpina TaxID=576137 RepID=A0A1L7WE55_9HELO|nr:uncharacterized protein PAC_00938 [Phialocephala subalpina]